jgi:hypothetical protein
MSNKQVKNRILYEPELSAWKYYFRQSVKVYPKNGMLRAGRKSWWSRIQQSIPSGFVDNVGRIREPWITEMALWMLKHGLRISECLDISVDNVVPTAISVILAGLEP